MLDTNIKKSIVGCYVDLLTSRTAGGIKKLTGQNSLIPDEFNEIETMPGYELNERRQVLTEKTPIHLKAIDGELSFCVDIEGLKLAIKLAKMRARDEYLIKEFMRRGASNDCLHSLFGLNSRSKLHYVEHYGIQGDSGRPSKRHSDDIIEAFGKLDSAIELKERLLIVADSIEVNIGSVWCVINEYMVEVEDKEFAQLVR
jgi:hypothetical protein